MSEPTPNPPRPDQTAPPASKPAAPAKRRRHIVIGVVLIVLVALAALIFFRGRPGEQATQTRGRGAGGPPAPAVTTVTSQKGDIGIYVTGLGTVTPLYTVAVNSRVSGQLMKVSYAEGQLVKAGDPLLEIDPGPYEAALLQAKGQLARDQATLENAKIDQERYKEAYASNAIPEQQLATQIATVHQDEGTVLLDQGVLSNAQVQLNYCFITAPIPGRVGLRLVDPGNIVNSANSNALVVITEQQPITVIFALSEDYIRQILQQFRSGKTMEVDAYDRAQEKKLASGILDSIDNQINTTTGTVNLRALFTNEDNALFPNEFVNARLLVDTLHDATLVPTPVIQRDSQGAFVYLVNTNQTVSTNPVVVRVTDSFTDTSAVEGLEPGKVLVSDNFNKLTDGMKVTVREPGSGGKNGHGGRNNGEGQNEGSGEQTNVEKQ